MSGTSWWYKFINGESESVKNTEPENYIDFIKKKINGSCTVNINLASDKYTKSEISITFWKIVNETGTTINIRYIDTSTYSYKDESGVFVSNWIKKYNVNSANSLYDLSYSKIAPISKKEFNEIEKLARNKLLSAYNSDSINSNSHYNSKAQIKKVEDLVVKKGIENSVINSESDIDKILSELDDLVGMDNVKQEVKTLINIIRTNKLRKDSGLPVDYSSLHCVFTGNPGSGKTTIARVLAKVYNSLGILSTANFVEMDRAGLVAAYVGQTALKTEKVIESALDGVLFIDEAYSLKRDGANDNDFGQEAIDVIVKRMEDYRDKLVIIVAGYEKEMKTFIDSNPGLKSRFNKYFSFKDYSVDELIEIFKRMCLKNCYTMSGDIENKLRDIFSMLHEDKTKNFSNGRMVRNIFDKAKENQSNRISKIDSPTKEQLMELIVEDVNYETGLITDRVKVGF